MERDYYASDAQHKKIDPYDDVNIEVRDKVNSMKKKKNSENDINVSEDDRGSPLRIQVNNNNRIAYQKYRGQISLYRNRQLTSASAHLKRHKICDQHRGNRDCGNRRKKYPYKKNCAPILHFVLYMGKVRAKRQRIQEAP
jgi:hypothetical protein